MPRSSRKAATAAIAFILASALSRTALADGLVGEAERWLTAAAHGPTAASEPTTRMQLTAERAVSEQGATAIAVRPFFRLAPTVSVVARDWRGSTKIAGDRTLLVDDLRPTASNRLVIGRIATDARLSVFVQAGLGQWRIDSAMFPALASDSKLATQIGTGFELRLSSRTRIAAEGQYTILPADLHTGTVAPSVPAFLVAFDARF